MTKKVILVSVAVLCLLAIGLCVAAQIFQDYQNRQNNESIQLLLSNLPLDALLEALSASGFIKVSHPDEYAFNGPMVDETNNCYVFTKDFMALRLEYDDNTVVSVAFNMIEYF